MRPRPFDWKAFEAKWTDAVDRAVAGMARKHPKEAFYALAFHHGYAETERRIDEPAVGMNSEEAFAEMHGDEEEEDGGASSVRWSPPDWRWEDLELGKAVAAHYRALNVHALAGDRAHWQRVFARHQAAIVNVAKALAARARAGEGGFSRLVRVPDFVVFHHDESKEWAALMRRSIPRATFARLFAGELVLDAARKKLAAAPIEERCRHLVSCFGLFEGPITTEEAQSQLAAIGAPAVATLAEKLADPKDGWVAAMVLAKMGAPAASGAAKELLRYAKKGDHHSSMWSARALGRLGKVDDLVRLARSEKTRAVGVDGLTAARPRSYEAIGELLGVDPKTARLFAERLRPGSSRYDKAPGDFDTIVQAATSPHAVVRVDVASALGDDELGEKNRARAVPVLLGMLGDRTSEVRRLAVLGLGRCGRHAKAATDRVRAVAESDKNPKVRDAAKHALSELSRR